MRPGTVKPSAAVRTAYDVFRTSKAISDVPLQRMRFTSVQFGKFYLWLI